jgi:hypothetical protein
VRQERRCPTERADLTTTRARLPEVIALEAQRLYLQEGLPLERLKTAALGVHQLQLAYWRLTGEAPGARTIHNWRRELLGAPVGQMPVQRLPASFGCPLKLQRTGANQYDLPSYAELWQVVKRAILDALSTRRREKRQRYGVENPVKSHIRALGALDWAVRNAAGKRNIVGYRLVLLLRRLGLDRGEVDDWMEDYQAQVCALDTPSNRYTVAEVRATVRSAMRKTVAALDGPLTIDGRSHRFAGLLHARTCPFDRSLTSGALDPILKEVAPRA